MMFERTETTILFVTTHASGGGSMSEKKLAQNTINPYDTYFLIITLENCYYDENHLQLLMI